MHGNYDDRVISFAIFVKGLPTCLLLRKKKKLFHCQWSHCSLNFLIRSLLPLGHGEFMFFVCRFILYFFVSFVFVVAIVSSLAGLLTECLFPPFLVFNFLRVCFTIHIPAHKHIRRRRRPNTSFKWVYIMRRRNIHHTIYSFWYYHTIIFL